MAKLVNVSRRLWAIPCITASLATCAYLFQGGFGAGHGPLDPVIFYLGLPAIAFIESMPIPRLVERTDLLLVIWWPALLNAILLLAIGNLVHRFSGRRAA